MPDTVPAAAPLRRRILSSVATISLALAGVVAFAPPAYAAVYGPSYDIGNGHLGAYSVGGVNVYCLEIEKARPVGATSGPVYQGWGSLSPLDLARINMAVTTFGQSADRRMTAAVDLYVWSVADAAEYNSHGMSGDSWFITRATGSDIPTIRANLAAIRDAAAATTVGVSGGGTATLSVQMFDSYDGQVTVAVSPVSATGTLHLDGATVAGTPADTAPVTNGSVIPIRGTPLDSQTEEYAITASATFMATNSGGYLAQIAVYTTGAAQRLAGPGGQPPASFTFSASDYVTDPLELQFEPIVTTQVSDAMLQPGEPMVDVLTAGLSATSPSSEWRADGAGNYAPVAARGHLYGPFVERPNPAAAAPPGAPLAWSETVLLVGPGEYSTSGEFEATESGYYTWVWEIDAGAQAPAVRMLLPSAYRWQDDFGLVKETSTAAVALSATTSVSELSVGLWHPVTDTLTVSHDDRTGAWWTTTSGEPVAARFRGTAYWIAGDEPPLVSDDPPSDAVVLAVREFSQISAPGSYTTFPVTAPLGSNGFIVWQWELVTDPEGPFVPWRDQFGVSSETTRVLVPSLSTAAEPLVAVTDGATDTATIGGLPTGRTTYLSFALYQQTDPEEPRCDATTVIADTGTSPIEVTGPGDYMSPPVTLEAVGTYFWIATLRSPDGEVLASGVCGDPKEVSEAATFIVSTEAVERVAPGEFARDVATVSGKTPDGATISFAAYRQVPGSEPMCDQSNRIHSDHPSPALVQGEGFYSSPPVELTAAGTYLWVETVQSRTGVVLHEGECGAKYELTRVQQSTLAMTGTRTAPILALAATLVAACGVALLLRARRAAARRQ